MERYRLFFPQTVTIHKFTPEDQQEGERTKIKKKKKKNQIEPTFYLECEDYKVTYACQLTTDTEINT